MSLDPITILANYGIAGIVIYLFYSLLCKELRALKESIDKLCEKIDGITSKISGS